MNEKLNLVEILKDCPKGTKLYSPLFGEVEFDSIDLSRYDMGQSDVLRVNIGKPVVVRIGSFQYEYFTKDGKYDVKINQQECMLFPSKEVRTWDNFKPKKPKFDPKTLHPFDKILGRSDTESPWLCHRHWNCDIFSHIDNSENYPIKTVGDSYKYAVPYNEETKHLVGTTDEAPEYYRYWED